MGGSGADLGGAEEGETITRTHCVRNKVFSQQKEKMSRFTIK